MNTVLCALIFRECAAIAASRVVWVFAFACGASGLAVAFSGFGGSTAVWLALPLVLYLVPLLGLLVGVSAARGDMDEEALLVPRAPRALVRLGIKWFLWSVLLALTALAWLLPAALRAGDLAMLPSVWFYTFGEACIFVALGLALGRLVRDGVSAHVGALVLGFVFVAGAGVIGWLAAQSAFFQEHPSIWTLGLMLHPVEALRVSLMFSMENLPFDAGHLPGLAAWWLKYPGAWYAGLAVAWSAAAVFLGAMRRFDRV